MKSALIWKLLERFGVQGAQFFLQIILARLLDPHHYGTLSLMIIFTTLANVFIQNGFNTALIQNKDVTEEDYSSVFWVSLDIALLMYGLLYITAPLIGDYYRMPDIVSPFRVLALILIPGAFNSVQLAKVSREMDFKKVFYSNVGGILAAGITGIILAYCGYGIWALVAQNLLNITVACIVMLFTVDWHPKFVCDPHRVKVLFSYGWKLLVSSLIDTLYQDIQSLVIGRIFDSSTLGFFNRGKQFPQFLINAVNGSVQSVMLPAMSALQDRKEEVKKIMRQSITLSAFIIFPMMACLAGISEPLVKLLLTDKWLPCVPYMRLFCFSFAFWPVHTSNLSAINAMGRSDIFLKLEVIKKSYGLGVLIIAVFFFKTPLAIAGTGLVTSFISCFVNAFPNKNLINYSFKEQMSDLVPTIIMSIVTFVSILFIGELNIPVFPLLCLQIFVGLSIYLLLSILTKSKSFSFCVNLIRKTVQNRCK